MMEVILKMNNFEVVKAQNGFEAFEKAAEAMQFTQQNIKQIVEQWDRTSFEMFDVIILDLNMPISDGYEACKKISQMYDETRLLQNHEDNTTACLIRDLKPLLYACTGDDVENPRIKVNLEEAGFDQALTNPLTSPYIKDNLVPMIH